MTTATVTFTIECRGDYEAEAAVAQFLQDADMRAGDTNTGYVVKSIDSSAWSRGRDQAMRRKEHDWINHLHGSALTGGVAFRFCLLCDREEWADGTVRPGTEECIASSQPEQASHSVENDAPYLDIVFDGPPSHESGRFIEVESPAGRSVSVGEWIDRGDGMWALRIPRVFPPGMTNEKEGQ